MIRSTPNKGLDKGVVLEKGVEVGISRLRINCRGGFQDDCGD